MAAMFRRRPCLVCLVFLSIFEGLQVKACFLSSIRPVDTSVLWQVQFSLYYFVFLLATVQPPSNHRAVVYFATWSSSGKLDALELVQLPQDIVIKVKSLAHVWNRTFCSYCCDQFCMVRFNLWPFRCAQSFLAATIKY